MGEKQVTIMMVKVDLQCHRCYKKIKRILCKFPQIRDQVYDEKQNTVIIKVVCCSPEKIKEKIICKGGDTVKGIEIKVPEKPKPKEPEKPKEPPPKPKEPEKPKEPPPKPKEPEKPKEPPPKPKEPEKPKEPPPKPKPTPPAPPPKHPEPPPPAPIPFVPWCPPPPTYPRRTCCTECYEGRTGGPCFYGCGPSSPPPCYQYDGYYGRPVYDSYGGGSTNYTSRCTDYFSEENRGACSIM